MARQHQEAIYIWQRLEPKILVRDNCAEYCQLLDVFLSFVLIYLFLQSTFLCKPPLVCHCQGTTHRTIGNIATQHLCTAPLFSSDMRQMWLALRERSLTACCFPEGALHCDGRSPQPDCAGKSRALQVMLFISCNCERARDFLGLLLSLDFSTRV